MDPTSPPKSSQLNSSSAAQRPSLSQSSSHQDVDETEMMMEASDTDVELWESDDGEYSMAELVVEDNEWTPKTRSGRKEFPLDWCVEDVVEMNQDGQTVISFAPASLASSVNASPFAGVTPKRKSRPPHHPGSPFPHHDRRHQRLHPASGHQRTSAPTDDLEDEVE